MNRFEQSDGLDLAWQVDVNCAGTNPDIFFPTTVQEERLAKSVCADCVVRVECYDYAVATNRQEGVWGGHNFGNDPSSHIFHPVRIQ